MNNILLAFFRTPYTEEYRSLVLAATIAQLQIGPNSALSERTLTRMLDREFAFDADTVSDALSALRSRCGLHALHMWKGRNDSTMLRLKDSPELSAWIGEHHELVSSVANRLRAA